MEESKDGKSFHKFVEIVARLRGKDGCPWDREQTHSSLRQHFLEECYEVIEALDEGNLRKLREELGDVLLHLVMQAQIATESGEFDITDVVEGITAKIVRRHPHVFGDDTVNGIQDVLKKWNELKKEERGKNTSLLDSVPKQLPSLSYCQEIQHRAAEVGFDWENTDGIIDKLSEEVDEFRQAPSPEEREKEFGDILFTLANLGRRMDIDLETALRETSQRFYRRFTWMEQECRERNINLKNLSFDEQNRLWENAKRQTQE